MSKENVHISLKHLYEGSTKNVIKSVILGKAVAGATLDVDFEKEENDMTGQLRIIMRTREIASHPLSAHPRVPAGVQEALSRAVLTLAKKADAELLRMVRLPDPVKAEYRRDYGELEEIDVEKLAAEK